jgi:hypothetical protein
MTKKKSSAGMFRVPLQEALDHSLEDLNDEGPRGYIGASIVAQECERALWYDWTWATPKKFIGRILRRFAQGHANEARLITELRDAGYEVHSENPRARNDKKQYRAEMLGGVLSGGVDGFIRGGDRAGLLNLGDRWHLLEAKIVVSSKYHYGHDNDFSDPDLSYDFPVANKHPTQHPTSAGNESNIEGKWWTLHRRGVKAVFQTYYGQMQGYMGLSHQVVNGKPVYQSWGLPEPLTRALFVAANTDTEQLHAEIVEYEPDWFAAIQARAKRTAQAKAAPPRIAENPMFPPCRFCDHLAVCHYGNQMAKSCRTCIHSAVRLPGDKGYWGKRAAWLCTLHKQGCGDFEPCESWAEIEPAIEF